ncbi:MAG: NmrA family NAD(P)-binding protein [Verrucomicrobia bacterium]|nr:NmrA family NAD(P)-binding protein [Verrucomicrobiota bacterium]
MKILVTGATGRVGSEVVKALLQRGADVRALTRKQPKPGTFPSAVEIALGDLTDPVSTAEALKGVDKLFLLNGGAPDELVQALTAYSMSKKAGLKHVTYASIFKADQFLEVPHFAAKYAVEGAIRAGRMPYTILRPAYFLQNERGLKAALIGAGIYPIPVGNQGVAVVDVRDIAEAAAISLTEKGHEGKTYDQVSSDMLTGPEAAATWSKLLDKEITYAGHGDFDNFEAQMRKKGNPLREKANPNLWLAHDLRLMFEGFIERGFRNTEDQTARFAALLGHQPKTYSSYAEELAAEWAAA